MSNIIETFNKENGEIRYLHLPAYPSKKELKKIFTSGTFDEILGSLIDMGRSSSDFLFVIRWVEILANHPHPYIRRNSLRSLGYFCEGNETIEDPNRVVNLLVKGILDPHVWCYYDLPEIVRSVYGGRLYERECFIRSVITKHAMGTILKTFGLVESKLEIKNCTIRMGEQKITSVFSVCFKFIYKNIPRIQEREGEIENYNILHFWNGPENIASIFSRGAIESGTITEALKQILLMSWHENQFNQFIEGIQIALNRPEAIIQFYSLRAIWDYMVIFRKFYENKRLFGLLNGFIESKPLLPPPPFPSNGMVINARSNPDTWPSPSPLEYYEHQDLGQQAIEQIESMQDFIIYATAGYDDDEE